MRQALGPGALGRPGGSGWRGRWEGGTGWGRHVNSRPFHFKNKKINQTLYPKKIKNKSRDITLPTKARLVKAMVSPVVMFGCESWTVKKVEHTRIDVFELWCWRRLLRVPWTARRSNQSILKEISPGCSLEGLMLKLTLQYIGHLI